MAEKDDPGVASRLARPRNRRGLGRGLGALIPGIEDIPPEKAERPLDVFFPESSGASAGTNAGASSVRGGSARDLLSPGRETRIVSRETKRAKATREVRQDTGRDDNRNVSRETLIVPGASKTADTEKSHVMETSAAQNIIADAPIVSRETIASDQGQDRGVATESDLLSETHSTSPQQGSERHDSPSAAREEIVSRETIEETAQLAMQELPDGALQQPDHYEIDSDHEELVPVPGATFGAIPTAWIIPNLKQPRDVFAEEELFELAQSIREVGVLQPIVVRAITAETLAEPGQAARLEDALKEQPNARYELIMGERRWRAASLAQLPEIPAIIRNTDEDELLREALIENLHRVQLNPLEEAAAYNQLLEDFSYTQEELSKKIHKSRSQVANTLRLLKLPSSVQWKVAANVLSAGHARALLSLSKQSEMEALADRIVAEGLSVRATEEIIRFGRQERPKRTHSKPYVPPAAQRVAEAFAAKLDTSVKITVGANKGRLIIEYADADDLNRIAAILDLGTDNPQQD